MKKSLATILLSVIGVCGLHSQEVKQETTFRADENPIIRYKYTADPTAMSYNGKFYLYTGYDVCPPRENRYVMNEM
jgi:hypothetical protein